LRAALGPVRKAGLEQVRVEGCNDLAQRVVARNAVRKRQKALQEREVLAAPQGQFNKVVRTRNRAAQQQEQQLGQGIQHFGRLPRVAKRCKMHQERHLHRLGHGPPSKAPYKP